MRKIAGTFLASALALQANAQDTIGSPAPEKILSSDETAQIILQDINQTNANGFLVLCPGYLKRELYSKNPGQAVVIVLDHDLKTLETGLRSARQIGGKEHFALANSGFIYTGNKIDPAYTLDELANKTHDVLDKPNPLTGGKAHDPALIQKLLNHAQNFCFARF